MQTIYPRSLPLFGEELTLGKTEIFHDTRVDNKQKKEWAKLFLLTTDLTQAEIAVKIEI